MKKVSIYVCVIMLLLCCFSSIAFADSESDSSFGEASEDLPVSGQIIDTPSVGTLEFVPASSTNTVLRVSASDTSGLHSIILSMIGDYNPIATTTEYKYPYGNGYQSRYQVDVSPDWSWICTAGIFLVIIYCVFRLIGALFSGRI